MKVSLIKGSFMDKALISTMTGNVMKVNGQMENHTIRVSTTSKYSTS